MYFNDIGNKYLQTQTTLSLIWNSRASWELIDFFNLLKFSFLLKCILKVTFSNTHVLWISLFQIFTEVA